MKQTLILLVGFLCLISYQPAIANDGIDPTIYKTARNLNKAVKNKQLTKHEVLQLAKQGKIVPEVLWQFNQLQNNNWFTKDELEFFNQSYYGKKAHHFLYKTKKTTQASTQNSVQYELKIRGKSSGNQLGYCVASAGDVNNDGFDDVIVGAPGYSDNTGRAYIFYGGTNMDNIADLTLTGVAVSNYFGRSVSSAGDVNKDGFDDVIVGANGYSSNTGRAYIYYGGSNMNNIHDVFMTGMASNIEFGTVVGCAGDVNNDGYDDVLIGAPRHSTNTGRAYIYLGGSSMNNIVDVTLIGEAAEDMFGASLACAGDLNNDNYDDVIIGAPGNSTQKGRAYVYYGGSIMNNVADVTFSGTTTDDFLGLSVSSAGDVNNDGLNDVMISAPGFMTNTGRVYIYYGSDNFDDTPDAVLTGEEEEDYFGFPVSSLGDINGDGFDDILVGRFPYDARTGCTYMYYGNNQMNNVSGIQTVGEGPNELFGFSSAVAGNIKGDGKNYIITGAIGNLGTGAAYIYEPNVAPTLSTQPESQSVTIGESISFSVDGSFISTYQWQINTGSGFADIPEGGIYSGANSSTLTIANVGEEYNYFQFRCIVSNKFGFAESETALLTVWDVTSIDNELAKAEIKVFPNPTNGILKFGMSKEKLDNIRILNLSGKVLLSKQNVQAGGFIDISGFDKGMYLMEIKSNSKTFTTKVIKR